MELIQFKDGRGKSFLLHVSQDEALQLVRSLVVQIQTWDPNSERVEFTSCVHTLVVVGKEDKKSNCYFSAAVTPYPVRMPRGFRETLQERLVNEEAVSEFDKSRRREQDCLPLTDYEKTLLAQFLKSLTSTP